MGNVYRGCRSPQLRGSCSWQLRRRPVSMPPPSIIKDAPSKQPVLRPPLGTAEATAVPKVLGGSTPPTLACDGATKVTWGRNSGHSGLCEVAPGCRAIPAHTGVQVGRDGPPGSVGATLWAPFLDALKTSSFRASWPHPGEACSPTLATSGSAPSGDLISWTATCPRFAVTRASC